MKKKMTIQIKTFLYFPPTKTNEKELREGVIKFFDEVNVFLASHTVKSDDIFISDSTDYIFVHLYYKIVKKK